MKSIPSLVATSTVGVAATGLVFGRPQHSTPPRPSSNKRKAAEYEMGNRTTSSSHSRPATSSTMRTPIREQPGSSSPLPTSPPSDPRLPSLANNLIEHENVRGRSSTARIRDATQQGELSSEERKDSVSSRGSWYRRLSTIQPSQNASPRSSIGPDSPSLTFSHGSAAPILHTLSSPTQLPPNKLVKRTTSGRAMNGGTISRSGSKSQVPTLRRPATSHQRSATLQQQFREQGQSFEIPRQQDDSPEVPSKSFSATNDRTYWTHYFDSRATKLTKEKPAERAIDGGTPTSHHTSRRVLVSERSTPPTLVKPDMIINATSVSDGLYPTEESNLGSSAILPSQESTPDEEPHKRPRRSLSMHFSSPTTWISRSSSLRAPKRGAVPRVNGKRYSSAPLPSVPGRTTISAHAPSRRRDITDPTIYQRSPELHGGDTSPRFLENTISRNTNSSSPLPPLSRLSTFNLNLDLARVGLSSSSSSNPARQTPVSPDLPSHAFPKPVRSTLESHRTVSSPVILHQSRVPRVTSVAASDRASTLIGSDIEGKGFASEDDTDYQSETIFDSFRTGTTASMRVRSPALESMFDESPTALAPRPKSLTINDLVANASFRESSDRIMEEDEGMSTPMRDKWPSGDDKFNTPTRNGGSSMLVDEVIRSSPPSFSLASKAFGRLSLEDDEEDEDWTRDDDSIAMGSLSPPSSSINSHRISPSVRLALADVTKSGQSYGNSGPEEERPKSVFDWSEPYTAEKSDVMGNSPRPRTVHGKQIVDSRGGRAVGRRGPTAIHIRSQSVPVVPDISGHRENTKITPKFGTWGLGAKGVSEDWDNDFEFDSMDIDESEKDIGRGRSMMVPPAIQASQASVVGHVGQIREVCLLVEDLKRLRGLAKEKGILSGPSASLWREADGIIALAIPDEEDATLSAPQSPMTQFFDDQTHPDAVARPRKESIESHIQNSKRIIENFHGRRRSVFSPEDDIFGTGGDGFEDGELPPRKSSQDSRPKDSTDVARSVMEHIHKHRAISDPLLSDVASKTPNKMPFDTTSLRDLVQRASNLTRKLSEIIRKADESLQSPMARTPQQDQDSSPAFTRVFTDPLASPPKHLVRTQSNNSMLNGSIDSSPTRRLGQRMHMMTVV